MTDYSANTLIVTNHVLYRVIKELLSYDGRPAVLIASCIDLISNDTGLNYETIRQIISDETGLF